MFNCDLLLQESNIAEFPFQGNGSNRGVSDLNMTMNGTVPFAFVNPSIYGIQAAGPFSDLNYFTNTALQSAFSNKTNYEISLNVNYASRANGPVAISYKNGILDCFLQTNSVSPYLRWNSGAADNLDITNDVVGTGVWRNIRLVCMGATDKRLYVDNVLVGQSTQNATMGTMTALTVGKYQLAPSFSTNGFVSDLKFTGF